MPSTYKFYVTGATGFLGTALVPYLRSRGHTVFTDRVDVTDLPALKKKFREHSPDVVINLAGVRAYPTIDWCEDHKEETTLVNVTGALNVAFAALEVGAYPIQISSGCIYSGTPETPFTEEDAPNFFGSYYSRMRVVLQEALKELPVLQVRIRMPLSRYSHPRNLINKIASYPQVISIPNSVTLVEDLLPALEKLSEIRPLGILNVTNEGYVTHRDILEAYKAVVDPNHCYELITLDQLEGKGGITKAKRSNCVLSTKKAQSLGLSLPQIDAARLREIMLDFKYSL
jgi:dTDP-4-dehydrorhamnose reductase